MRWPDPAWTLAASLASAALVALPSCHKSSGSSPSDQGATSTEPEITAKGYFLDSVYPRIAGASACGGCHSGGVSTCSAASCQFIGSDGPSTYSLIERSVGYISAPQKSPLLTYQHTDRTDARVALTGDQANVLGIWLGMEANTRHLPGAIAKASNLRDAYDQFGKCMNFDVFVGTGMNNLPFIETDFDGPCTGCHGTGQAGLWLAADPRLTFEKMKTFPYIQKFVVGSVDRDGNFKELIPAGRLIEKANEPCPPGATGCHPPYGLSEDTRTSIEYFVNVTLQNLAAGTCANGIVAAPDAGRVDLDGGGQ